MSGETFSRLSGDKMNHFPNKFNIIFLPQYSEGNERFSLYNIFRWNRTVNTITATLMYEYVENSMFSTYFGFDHFFKSWQM